MTCPEGSTIAAVVVAVCVAGLVLIVLSTFLGVLGESTSFEKWLPKRAKVAAKQSRENGPKVELDYTNVPHRPWGWWAELLRWYLHATAVVPKLKVRCSPCQRRT